VWANLYFKCVAGGSIARRRNFLASYLLQRPAHQDSGLEPNKDRSDKRKNIDERAQ
jgi:hypothetical protein